jgi:dTMP kinase
MSLSHIPHKGFLLGIEGPDGAGKSTLRTWLSEWFQGHGLNPVLTREPGGTPEAEIIRERILMDREPGLHETLPPLAKTLMFMSARALHLENMIWPRLKNGELIITDRFCDSTFAYQREEGMDYHKLKAMHGLTFDEFQPDLTIILDGNPLVFRERLVARAAEYEENYYDRKPLSFHENTRATYLQCAAEHPHRYLVVDAEQSFEQVQAQLIPMLMKIDAHMRKRPETA